MTKSWCLQGIIRKTQSASKEIENLLEDRPRGEASLKPKVCHNETSGSDKGCVHVMVQRNKKMSEYSDGNVIGVV
jgi:hypothetical protein